MYYRNIPEMQSILADDAQLSARFNRIVKSNLPAVYAMVQSGDASMTPENFLAATEFLFDLQAQASPKLRMDIEFILRGIESGWLLQWLGVEIK